MRNRLLLVCLLLPPLAVTALGLMVLYHLPLEMEESAPLQPISFSHRLHAGESGIPCLFCHRFAEDSPVAGVPDVELCRGCHMFIAQDRPGIQQLNEFWNRQEPIPWVRLHRIPDHAYFPHMMHLRAGLECAGCHGEVSTMETTRRVVSIKMGWCLNCHREHGASIDCWTCHR